MSGSAWDVIQGVGALATAGALIAIIFQTRSMKKQTELLDNEMDYRLRPWLYPADTWTLLVKRWNDVSKQGLEIIVHQYFINEGMLPAKSFLAYITCSRKKVEDYKAQATIFPGYAIFPKREFHIEGYSFFKDLNIEDNMKFSDDIYIAVRLEYEYGAGTNTRSGFYQGLFRVKEIQYKDTLNYDIYSPITNYRKDDFG